MTAALAILAVTTALVTGAGRLMAVGGLARVMMSAYAESAAPSLLMAAGVRGVPALVVGTLRLGRALILPLFVVVLPALVVLPSPVLTL